MNQYQRMDKESNVLYQLIFQQKHSLKFKKHEVHANGSGVLFVIRYRYTKKY